MAALVPSHPGASTPAVAARMSVFPRRDTTPELALRRLLHASGRRYSVNFRVPTRHRRTIDHRHPSPSRMAGTPVLGA
jgi:DNA mismatch endonuclease, patch repair protein